MWISSSSICLKKKRADSESVIFLAIALLGNNLFELVVWKILSTFYQHGFRYRCWRISSSFEHLRINRPKEGDEIEEEVAMVDKACGAVTGVGT